MSSRCRSTGIRVDVARGLVQDVLEEVYAHTGRWDGELTSHTAGMHNGRLADRLGLQGTQTRTTNGRKERPNRRYEVSAS